MMILKPAALSGIATALAYWLWVVVLHRPSNITVLAVVIATFILWVIGSFSSLYLLLILHPLYKRISRTLSLVIFSLIGFLLPAYPTIWTCVLPVHDFPALFERDPIRALAQISANGIVGLSTAITAWYFLGENKAIEADSTYTSVNGSSETICIKKTKPSKIMLGLLIAILIAFVVLSHPLRMMNAERDRLREIFRENVAMFINLPASEYERLIKKSKRFYSDEYKVPYHHKPYSTDTFMISKGHAKLLPDEFVDFGIYQVSLQDKKLYGRLYYAFRSGGRVVIDWSDPNQTTIEVKQGHESTTKVYPRKENNELSLP